MHLVNSMHRVVANKMAKYKYDAYDDDDGVDENDEQYQTNKETRIVFWLYIGYTLGPFCIAAASIENNLT